MTQPQSFGHNRRIEPGCLCLIIAGPLAGSQCTALELKPAGFIFNSLSDNCIKELLAPCWIITFPPASGQPNALIEEHKLRRIDGWVPEADELSQVLPLLRRKGASA